MGDFSRSPVLTWYLKKDLREEIFRFIDFEVIFWSLRLASQERINEAEISETAVSPKVVSR